MYKCCWCICKRMSQMHSFLYCHTYLKSAFAQLCQRSGWYNRKGFNQRTTMVNFRKGQSNKFQLPLFVNYNSWFFAFFLAFFVVFFCLHFSTSSQNVFFFLPCCTNYLTYFFYLCILKIHYVSVLHNCKDYLDEVCTYFSRFLNFLVLGKLISINFA